MRDDISLFGILFEPYVLGWNAKQYHSLKPMWMLYAYPCCSLKICFVIPITHSFGWAFWYVVPCLLLNHLFDANVKLNFFSMISCKWLHFKCYWGSEDSMLLGVRYFTKINNPWKVKISRVVEGKRHHCSTFSSIG
jgi:hypothetical protein